MIKMGEKFDNLKPRPELLPPEAIMAVAEVLAYGAKKYAAHNWKLLENAVERYDGASLRHQMARMGGEVYDQESKLLHSAHQACNALFTLYFDLMINPVKMPEDMDGN